MKPLHENPYVQDILSQPDSLRLALEKFDAAPLAPLRKAIQRGGFERIVLTGMGASLYAAYPAWLTLAQAGLPALWVDTAELVHHAQGLLTSRTLFWLFSQSGRSAEIVSALDFERIPRPGALLATVNDNGIVHGNDNGNPLANDESLSGKLGSACPTDRPVAWVS
jgi:glucosamine--fructose-6-phosphate aminotransferase (isomerizing)